MRRTVFLIALSVGAASCDPIGFKAVSISPIYGWEDGCTSVKISGTKIAADATATIGDIALESVSYPDEGESPLDVGFVMYGVTPPAAAPGAASVVVTASGETSTITDGFYYVACPAAAYIEVLDPASGVAAGSTISLEGCGLPTDGTVKLGANDAGSLSSVCGTASTTFTAPDLADGTYYLGIFSSAGEQLFPDPACDIANPGGSGDTGDTGLDPCADALTITYGEGR